MDTSPTTPPDWEKWRDEQVETISNILSHVFKVEDAARQTKTSSHLLRNTTVMGGKSEEEIREKLKLIREQLSEYEQMVQLGLKRIDNALEIIHKKPVLPTSRLKKWLRRLFR